MKLNRDRGTGRILDGSSVVTLIGGHYHLFRYDPLAFPGGAGDLGLYRVSDGMVHMIDTNKAEPCQNNLDVGTGLVRRYWKEDWHILWTMRANNLNLLRIFLTNAVTRTDLMPYNIVKDPGGDVTKNKLNIKDAVEKGNWNEEYFNRLIGFAYLAEISNITLQLSVFNFFDFRDEAWGPSGFSPWNPQHSYDSTNSSWSTDHLVSGASPGQRCLNFMNPNNQGLLTVKTAFINKLVSALRGRGNIIFELMNEPRGPNGNTTDRSPFLSQLTKVILAAAGSWRPLISVNASPDYLGAPPPFDIERWAKRPDQYFNEIDLVSYHGLSGVTIQETECGKLNDSFPRVDRDAIVDRRKAHFGEFSGKAMIFSTDGVFTYAYNYPKQDPMNLRDGQVRTGLKSDATVSPSDQRHFSDLRNWAYWCLQEAKMNPGCCHFQNHSSFFQSLLYIAEAYEAITTSSPPGQIFKPPFTSPNWTIWQWTNAPASDFDSDIQFRPEVGEITVGMATLIPPADAAKAAAAEVGFLHVFTPARDSVDVVADYNPVTIDIHKHWALVVAAVALRLHAIDAKGNVGALVARVPAILNPGAPPGQLRLSAAVTRGQRYGLILAADLGIQYEANNVGRGELIVQYLRVSLG